MKPQRYSRIYLRQLSVIFSAYEILHLEKNNLVARKTVKANHCDHNFDDDIPLDISEAAHKKISGEIQKIEQIVLNILRNVKIHKKDEDFFIQRSELIIQSFIDSGILKEGVSPHMAFTIMLFTYFADGKANKINNDFLALSDIELYENILQETEDSSIFDWGKHTEAVYKALNAGAGFSVSYTENWERIPISIDTFIHNGYSRDEARKLISFAKRNCKSKTIDNLEVFYLKDLFKISKDIVNAKTSSKFKRDTFSKIYTVLNRIIEKNSTNEVKIWSG